MTTHFHPPSSDYGATGGDEHGSDTAVWADGERTVAAHEDSGGFIVAWAERYGIDPETAISALAEAHEQLKSESGSDAHEAAVKAQRFYRNAVMAVKSYKGPRAFAFDCLCLALGWKDILGCNTQIELAKKWKCTKANVEKCVGAIQQICGIPETLEQRDDAARKKMSDRRKGQLKGAK